MGNGSNPNRFTPAIKLEHADSRGEIYSIDLPDGQELMLLHSKKGSFRGGHSHSCAEIVVLLSGIMRYFKKRSEYVPASEVFDPNYVTILKSGDVSHNPAGQIHMGEFLEDSWVVEYKLGTKKGNWSQENYAPYRERVTASSKNPN